MRTFTHYDFRIHHNSDGSGDVIIVDTRGGVELSVSCSALVAFVAELVRERRISDIEQMTPGQILGINP